MPLYALISTKIPIKKVTAPAPPKSQHEPCMNNTQRRVLRLVGSILSLSKKVVVFKAEKLTELTKGLKLVKIFQEYTPPKGFRIEEITPDIYERAPGFEEIKALIVDEIFKAKGHPSILFGLSFYDFEYLQPNFINLLGNRIKDELKKQGVKTKFKKVQTKPYLSRKQSKKLLEEGLEIVIIKKSSPPLSIYLGKTIKIDNRRNKE